MPLTRRELLASGIAAGTMITVPSLSNAAAPATNAPRRRVLRIAHLTDIHLQPELDAGRGLTTCFSHVQSLPERLGTEAPDMIITGGDTIMDAMDADMARTSLQWELWRKLKADHCGCELHSVLGNHDVWGWGRTKAKTAGDEPRYGKQWACDVFGRDRPYTSFDRAGWHIVLLDSVFPFQETYIGRLDDAQWDWLERDLAAVPATTPVIVFSHIPILSATSLTTASPAPVAEGTEPRPPALEVSGKMLHIDGSRFQKLFAAHPSVKACASGHVHLVEHLQYGGVDYFCNGAVSSGWWKGRHRGTDFGYSLLDLHDDGTVEGRYVAYGWTVPS
jgi:3',5'-cyclic AMP phosphodiesterase CpdA